MRHSRNILLMVFLMVTVIFAQRDDDAMDLNMMPVPTRVKMTGSKYHISDSFRIALKGDAGQRLNRYATRFLQRLSGRTGLFFITYFLNADSTSDSTDLNIQTERAGILQVNENESYQLIISKSSISLTSETDFGAMRGLETLLQLLHADTTGYYFPTIEIEDVPRFPWRGLLIDVSRHFMPVDVIKRNLLAMAALKMNVFHWHLTDDQGFRIECTTFPRLHEYGSDGFYFTREQVKEIISFATDLGIRVIPEFDIPAHTTSWFVGYPELASAPGPYLIERSWGIKDPVMNPAKEKTYEFLDRFFAEMSQLFTDEYIHIGGDENNGKHWDANPEIQQFMRDNSLADNHALQTYFSRRVLKILQKYGKKMIGWDEIFQPDLPRDVVIQSWRGHKSLLKSSALGYFGILSNGYYIDLIQPASFHYLIDPIPPDTILHPDQSTKILGGEATSWGELVTPETIDSRIWPRTAAIAERLWSPQNIRDIDDMYRRLEIIGFQLEELGLLHRKNYEMMLRRLAGDQDIATLKIFVDIVEPVKIYQRHFQGVKYFSYSPYTRVVDAARPESKTARRFTLLIDDFLKNNSTKALKEIRHWLEIWLMNHDTLKLIIRNSPVLKEIESMSQDLTQCSQIALTAVDLITKGKKADPRWTRESEKVLMQAKMPRGQVELMIIEPIVRLLKHVRAD